MRVVDEVLYEDDGMVEFEVVVNLEFVIYDVVVDKGVNVGISEMFKCGRGWFLKVKLDSVGVIFFVVSNEVFGLVKKWGRFLKLKMFVKIFVIEEKIDVEEIEKESFSEFKWRGWFLKVKVDVVFKEVVSKVLEEVLVKEEDEDEVDVVSFVILKCRGRFLKVKFEVVEEIEVIKKVKKDEEDVVSLVGFVELKKWGCFVKVKFEIDVVIILILKKRGCLFKV